MNFLSITDAGGCFHVEDLELQRQAVCVLNCVLYEQLQYKGNELDYYNPLNSYIHQVRSSRTAFVHHLKPFI